jgi:hypothetical protein
MIEHDERSWGRQAAAIIDRARTRATKEYISATLLAIALTPAIVEGLTLVVMFTEQAWQNRRVGSSLPAAELAGMALAMYFMMLMASLPALIPTAISHVVAMHLLRRRHRLNWLTAGASGALHGVLAILLFGWIFGGGIPGWPFKPSELAGIGLFALGGVLVALALHAAFPIFRRRWGVTAP